MVVLRDRALIERAQLASARATHSGALVDRAHGTPSDVRLTLDNDHTRGMTPRHDPGTGPRPSRESDVMPADRNGGNSSDVDQQQTER